MSKIIMFSRVFPSYHPRAGDPTYFVEKIWRSTGFSIANIDVIQYLRQWNSDKIQIVNSFYNSARSNILSGKVSGHKYTTIRAGHRWKVGDKFSPRVWSGKPYQSKQIIIAPDIEVKKVWDFDRDLISENCYINGWPIDSIDFIRIAENDGLNYEDLLEWFNKSFRGQIICWNDSIEY